MQTTVKVPGKLYLAGEYAVLTPGEPAIVFTVEKYLTLSLKKSADSSVTSDFHNNLQFSYERLQEIAAGDALLTGLKVCLKYAVELGRPLPAYKITVISELQSQQGKKYGFGSSGAVVVALIKAISQEQRWNLNDLDIFKLSMLTLWQMEENTSGGDVAAITHEGWILYRSPDASQAQHLAQDSLQYAIVSNWPGLEITKLPAPTSLKLAVAWTGNPAKTTDLIKQNIDSNKNTREQICKQSHKQFLAESAQAVRDIVEGLKQDDAQLILAGIKRSSDNLLHYLDNTLYVTPQLSTALEIAAKHRSTAKISGAGGGDCVVAFSETSLDLTRMLEEWQEEAITYLPVTATSFKEQND